MILDEIVANKRIEIDKRKTRIPLDEFRRRAESLQAPYDFAAALCGERVALIAEIKPASPSHGTLQENVDPVRTAQLYAKNGAAAISVLTDRKYFHGEPNNLKAARVACDLPLLRKDFIVDEYQIYESRALQADAILLIVRILENTQLRDYRGLAAELGMAALVEVHTEEEVERALNAGAQIIGVNNRNLANLTTDLATTERLASLIPRHVVLVSESGIATRSDVERMALAGADAVLVGQALMQADDVASRVQELSQVARHKPQLTSHKLP
ncbi:MAG: indole-3-glycerol phosphate synthase TrpC [Anaerolineae bacterium]